MTQRRVSSSVSSTHSGTARRRTVVRTDALSRTSVLLITDGAVMRWNVTSAGWQVTLCDPIWHVSFSSGVATSVSELLYPCYFTLLYFTSAPNRVAVKNGTLHSTIVGPSVRLKRSCWGRVRKGVATSHCGGPVHGCHPRKTIENLGANCCFLTHFLPET